jgi:hypothetical protein
MNPFVFVRGAVDFFSKVLRVFGCVGCVFGVLGAQEVGDRVGKGANENASENLRLVKEAMQRSQHVSLEIYKELIPPGGSVIRCVASGWSFVSCTLISVRNEEGFDISVVFARAEDEPDKGVGILRGKVSKESILGEILGRSDVIVGGLNKYAHER